MSTVTEKEAQQMVCIGLTNVDLCMGSKCMGWRWCEVMVKGPDAYLSEPGPKGYCGLAGLPLELQ